MSGNLLVRFDEGRVGRASLSPSLLLYHVSKVRHNNHRGETRAITNSVRTSRCRFPRFGRLL